MLIHPCSEATLSLNLNYGAKCCLKEYLKEILQCFILKWLKLS